ARRGAIGIHEAGVRRSEPLCDRRARAYPPRAVDMDTNAPDVILLGPQWPDRALLRAQLIEQGYGVVAIDRWPIPRPYRRPAMKPRAMIIDLRGLPDPRATLDEVRFVIPPHRVIVLMALGTLAKDDVQRLGFNVINRPATVGDVVAAVARVLAAGRVVNN